MDEYEDLAFVTTNESKFFEFKEIIGDKFNVQQKSLEVSEIQGSIEDIAREKCKQAYNILQVPVITEDTSLCLDLMKGFPGPYIKHLLDSMGQDDLYNLLAISNNFGAELICTFSYCSKTHADPILFQERQRGHIIKPRGSSKLGLLYQMFVPEQHDKSFAEMEHDKRNAISPRVVAINKIIGYLSR